MSAVFLSGAGAVSPFGWGRERLLAGHDGSWPAPQPVTRPGWPQPLFALRVPAPGSRPAWAAHGRLRRAAAISQFAMGAAAEAMAGAATDAGLGVVFCTSIGCVSYSRRFYDEVLRDPAVASPLLFPETVFNAPASHLSAVLGTSAANYTLVGDSGVFLRGLALAADWLADGRVARCLVVAAEEVDWISADAVRHFRKGTPLAEGAGALLLTRERTSASFAAMECVTDAVAFDARAGVRGRAEALARVRAALPAGVTAALGAPCEGFAAAVAWQVLMALDAARRAGAPRAVVAVPGAYQEAIGASFQMLSPSTP